MTPAERRRLSRLLSSLADAGVTQALAAAATGDGRCRRVGVTGPPGTGKSSLIANLAPHRLAAGGDLAIVAIDPSSPVSGGAILGDRIRMEQLATEPRIYIRSLATRSSRDGLADNLADILAALDAHGFAEAIVETVGVGQVEYAVGALVDTLLLVLPPGAGDQVQAMKSGVLEAADIVVINKADLPGARQLAAELQGALRPRAGWAPPIVPTSTADAASTAALSDAIDRHQSWSRDTGRWQASRAARRAHHLGSLLHRRVAEVLAGLPPDVLHGPIAGAYRAAVQGLEHFPSHLARE